MCACVCVCVFVCVCAYVCVCVCEMKNIMRQELGTYNFEAFATYVHAVH